MPVLSVINKSRVPVKIWSPLEDVEVDAIEQLKGVASLPFVFKHVAAMPDVHLGKGATVGSVVATKGAICPCAVGVDIGCGMHAIKTDIESHKILDRLPEIRSLIESLIPLGHESNKTLTESAENWVGWSDVQGISLMDQGLMMRARMQLGSLGGGNHFIELCLDTEGAVWIMLHSGSRHLGKAVAERHITTAKALMKQMFIDLPDPELAYLVQGTKEFDAYWQDLQWVQAYALENRNEMMRRILMGLGKLLGQSISGSMQVNCHHNYASLEHHYGENVIVTRKGAVRAQAGGLGIIPGSMGAKSYIVRGLGNKESFESCSHGAGRKMSRSEAKRRYSLADLERATQGVECRKDAGVIDEIPLAYKDIDVVMENQKDLVEVVATLKQVLCVKG
jgi:tRNA-splicing ligase RtcB (3'-phosphate/5'-hydroxy nucleic acid ligase)